MSTVYYIRGGKAMVLTSKGREVMFMKTLGGTCGIFSYSCDNLSFTKRRSCKKVDKKT